VITFVDTNVLLDIFLPDPDWGEESLKSFEMAFDEGSMITDEIVYAELAPQFSGKNLLDETLASLGIQVVPLGLDTAYKAGLIWKEYRAAGGRRKSVLVDFFIGAHALNRADRLLTRDRGFYKKHFGSLEILY